MIRLRGRGLGAEQVGMCAQVLCEATWDGPMPAAGAARDRLLQLLPQTRA